MRDILDVHIGEVKVARKGEVLKAILGSCVGIGVISRDQKVCALAHCLLPESPAPIFTIGARFVDQAVRSLVALVRIRPDERGSFEIIIVGGGNMTSPGVTDNEGLVGANNFRVAQREIKKLGLTIVYSDGGGENGRKIFIDSSDFSFRVEAIPRIVEAS